MEKFKKEEEKFHVHFCQFLFFLESILYNIMLFMKLIWILIINLLLKGLSALRRRKVKEKKQVIMLEKNKSEDIGEDTNEEEKILRLKMMIAMVLSKMINPSLTTNSVPYFWLIWE